MPRWHWPTAQLTSTNDLKPPRKERDHRKQFMTAMRVAAILVSTSAALTAVIALQLQIATLVVGLQAYLSSIFLRAMSAAQFAVRQMAYLLPYDLGVAGALIGAALVALAVPMLLLFFINGIRSTSALLRAATHQLTSAIRGVLKASSQAAKRARSGRVKERRMKEMGGF